MGLVRTDKETEDVTFFSHGMADEAVAWYCKDFSFVTRAEAKGNLYDLLMGANRGIEGAKVSWRRRTDHGQGEHHDGNF